MENSLFVISPYKYNGMWVFDDPSVDLLREPFVSGADVIIDILTNNIKNAEKGFNLLFSSDKFLEYTIRLKRAREESGGNWYYSEELDLEGWLCPALFKYFEKAPENLYVKALKKWGRS
jgi:hypothetical protein